MSQREIKSAAVIGAGLMGFGIGVEFARFGYPVKIYNTREATSKQAMVNCKEALDLMAETELITADEAKAAYGRIQPTTDIGEAATGADYVIECVLDQMAMKQDTIAKVEEVIAPDAIIATNTTALKITDMASKMNHPERLLLTHYFEPPHFIPLVEVGKGEKTDQAVVDFVIPFLQKMRKKVVYIPIDVYGGVGGTFLQGAMGVGTGRMLGEWGYTPRMIDDITTFGFGRRLAFTGSFERMDLIGLDFMYYGAKERGQEPPKWVAEHVEKGELGMKSGKGVYDWPKDKMEKFLRRYHVGLIGLMKRDMEEGAI